LNLYTPHSRDQIRVYHGCLATWLYIILLLISIYIIILFFDLSSQTINETIPNPSIEQYEKLQKQYSTKLMCPCTQISIPYGDFMKIKVRYHQICSSDFIQPWWYENLPLLTSHTTKLDFLSFASSYFQTLSKFCNFANTTVNDTIKRFLTTNSVKAQILSNDSFILEVNSWTNKLIEVTRTEFLYSMSLTNASLHSDQYLSNMKTSTQLQPLLTQFSNGRYSISVAVHALSTMDIKKKTCYCVLDSTCSLNYKMHQQLYTIDIDWQLEGIHGGCSIIDSVLKSSMICWFKDSCLTRLQLLSSKAGVLQPLSINLLDRKLPSRYSPDTSIETIFNEIMIEDWNFSYSFENFYHKCKPLSCSFTYEKKANIVYIITVITSLIGGIDIILRLISPTIIKIIFKFIGAFKHCRSLQVPTIQQENHRKLFVILSSIYFRGINSNRCKKSLKYV